MARGRRSRRQNPSPVAYVVAGIAAAGLALLWLGGRAGFDPSAPLLPPPAGVEAASGVKLFERQVRYLTRLRATLHPSVPLYVTSGNRTIDEQVYVMMNKYVKYPAEFKSIYNVAATRLLKLPWDFYAWRAEIVKMYDEGILHKDGHTGDGSVDLRTNGLSASQLAMLNAAVASIGSKPLIESDHMHVDIREAA